MKARPCYLKLNVNKTIRQQKLLTKPILVPGFNYIISTETPNSNILDDETTAPTSP